jgi:rsbT co-antagonist protein RsbR
MADAFKPMAPRNLAHEMGLTSQNIERRLAIVGLEAADVARIRSVQDVVTRNVDELTSVFFEYLSKMEEARPLLSSRQLADQVRQMKRDHLIAMVKGDYGTAYVEQRVTLGAIYGRAGLEPRAFLGAFQHLLRAMGVAIIKHAGGDGLNGFEAFASLEKVAFLDIGLIVDVLVFERERIIRQQQEAIRELSTPVLQIRERLLLLPIIGVIDTHRARLITESLLLSIRSNRAKVVVMDITGVATIDSKVANHLLQTVTAARLMGAVVIVTGLSADVAQSLVALGIELTKLNTVGDLQGGMEEAERILGYHVVKQSADLISPARA